MRTRDWKQVRLIHSNLWDWVQQGASFDETNVKQMPGAMDEWGAKTPVAQIEAPKGLHWNAQTLSGWVAGDYRISKICGEYV